MVMCTEDTPYTRIPNNDDIIRLHVLQEQTKALAKEKDLEDMEDEFIGSLIYHKMQYILGCLL